MEDPKSFVFTVPPPLSFPGHTDLHVNEQTDAEQLIPESSRISVTNWNNNQRTYFQGIPIGLEGEGVVARSQASYTHVSAYTCLKLYQPKARQSQQIMSRYLYERSFAGDMHQKASRNT